MKTMQIPIPEPEAIVLLVFGDAFHSLLAATSPEVTLAVLKQAVTELETQMSQALVPAIDVVSSEDVPPELALPITPKANATDDASLLPSGELPS